MGAAQQPVAQPGVARGPRQHGCADRKDRRHRVIGVELALLGARQLADCGVQDVGIGKPRAERRAGDVAGKAREIAGLHGGGELALVQVGLEDRRGRAGAQPGQEAGAAADDFGEQLALGREMGVEGAAGEAGRRNSRAACCRISARVRALWAGFGAMICW
jgi:hypothetical protein